MIDRLVSRFTFLFTTAVAVAAAPLWAVEFTTDTRIDATNVEAYTNAPLSVAAGATLTIDLAPTAKDQTFAGAVSGAGRIVVTNAGTKTVRFAGSFQTFTGALSATGSVAIGDTWNNISLNGTLSGVTVSGAGNRWVTFYGPNVLQGGGGGVWIGHRTFPCATVNLNGFDQTIATLGLSGFLSAPGADKYMQPSYTLKSDSAATLTIAKKISWTEHPTNHVSPLQVNGKLSLVFDGDSDAAFTFHGASETSGGLTVKAGEVTLASDATFNNLSSLTAAGTGRVVLETTAVNAKNLVLAIADSGAVALPTGDVFRVGMLKVDGGYLPQDVYSAEAIATLTDGRLSGAAVEVLSREVGEPVTFTWTGGGADDSLTTAANWADGVAPALTGGNEILVFASGTAATLATDADVYGISFATAGDFVLKGAADTRLRVGEGGVTCAAADNATRTVRLEVAPRVSGTQTWTIPASTVVDLAAGWAGYADVTLARSTGTGEILKFSSDTSPDFAGSLSVPDGNVLVLAGRGGMGALGACVTLNGTAGLRAVPTCVTNRAAIVFSHGPSLNVAGDGKEFVQMGGVTNVVPGSRLSDISVNGTLRFLGGLCEGRAHRGNPEAYKWWMYRFSMGTNGFVQIGANPILGRCPFRLFGSSISGYVKNRGTVHLSATGNDWSVLTLFNGVRVVCEDTNVLAANGDLGFNPTWPGSVDLKGYDQVARDALTVDSAGSATEGAGYDAMFVTSETPATLKLTGAATACTTHNLNFRGAASLHYAGTGRLALTNTASTTTGSLTVSSGEVALLAGAQWGSCTNVVVSGSGRLTLDTAVAASGAFSREATVRVDGDGTLAIPAGETVTVKYLYRDGEGVFSGFYRDGFVTGGGTLRVRRSACATGALLIIR